MKAVFLIVITFSFGLFSVFSQSQRQGFDDADVAQQYVIWMQSAINEGRLDEAAAVIPRIGGFSNVSSDISYLIAYIHSKNGRDRIAIITFLDIAIEVNRWVSYSAQQALLLKTEQLIAMQRYSEALTVINNINESAGLAYLRLLALKGLSETDPAALARFRSFVLISIDRYPRDPHAFRIFFEYAHNKIPDQSDLDLLDIVLRRLPFILDYDGELAWISAPYIKEEDARRQIRAYRSGFYAGIHARDFMPHPGSIPAALNLGIIDDSRAVDELFSGVRGINAPLPAGFYNLSGNPVLDIAVINETFSLLRSEEGRELFTRNLRSFTGIIYSDDNNDGFVDSFASYKSGVIAEFSYDINYINTFDFKISFSANELPEKAVMPVLGYPAAGVITWERYPFVKQAEVLQEKFTFRPADFAYAPLDFIVFGGSRNLSGLVFPTLNFQNINLTKRSLFSFAASISRPSLEFDNTTEEIFLERGIPQRAVEKSGSVLISVTEFVMGTPSIQYVDFDFDGRMETIRRFRRPANQEETAAFYETFDYSFLLISSESDWTGEGHYLTGEVYLDDGSVVYSWDIDGSGVLNYSETEGAASLLEQGK